MKRIRKNKKYFATFFAICLLSDILIPTFSFAITGHDSMPEYRSFEPVATTNMVNVFDGSFTYNIPLLEIPNGYPLSLSYHNNEINPDALASWVGWGWTLNPGAINRVKRGFPDEYNGETVRYHSKMPANWTISASVGIQPEIFGDESLVDVDLGGTVRYNNYSGLGNSIDLGFGFAGVASLDLSYANGRFGFNPDINPGELFMAIKQTFKERKNRKTDDQDQSQSTGEKKNSSLMQALKKRKEIRDQRVPKGANQKPQVGFSLGGIGTLSSSGSKFGSSLAAMIQPTSYPTSVSDYIGGMVNLKLAVGLNLLPVPIDGEVYVKGGFTVQVNNSYQDIPVYGYMHSETGYSSEMAMMDYFTENESIYEKRDNILAVPLPNNDIYNVTGEALGGAFRPFRPEFGHYRKNYVKSENFSVQAGADVNLPLPTSLPGVNLEFTIGAEAGGHYHYSSVGNWNQNLRGDADTYYKFKANNQFVNSNEKFFFRFSGDLGGDFSLIKNDDPYKPELVNDNFGLGNSSLDFGTPTFFNTNVFKMDGIDDRTSRRRSSYVNYHLNTDFSQTQTSTVGSSTFKYKVYENNLQVLNSSGTPVSFDHNNSTYNSDAMGEFVTHNADGVRYVYGLPVYTRKEKELQYSLKSSQVSSIDAGLIAYISNASGVSNGKRKLGYESDESYPNAHLLTQINSPDYIDRTGDGPTEDDFGSYTRFNYQRTAGESGNWYTYRTPHTGMSYNQGSLSDPDDDMGGFSTGQKELYYLHSIASKTHVAFFTLSDREDGLDANLTNGPSEDVLIAGVANSNTSIKLKKLSKIELYSINDCVKISGSFYRPKNQGQDGFNALPIKTVHFEYDYSLCTGIPNNQNFVQGNPNVANRGKLTLKRLWFEYEGKLTSKISPYVFDYEYPATTYPAPYTNLQYGSVYSAAEQNPNYSPLLTDRWGNYRNFSGLNTLLGNLSRFWPFVNQKDDPDFDPAAWCLKKIKLPSGGEIHIQYEEHDYQFVQDERAMMMMPLASNTTADETGTGEKKYYLDLAKVGITKDRTGNTINFGTTGNAAILRKEIAEDLFHPMEFEGKDRIYFNFLYALVDGNPSYSSYKSDYIEGYARIDGYGMDANGIYFKFKSNLNSSLLSGTDFYKKISYSSNVSRWELPHKACKNFVNNQRKGKLGDPPPGKALEDAFNSGDGEGMITAFADLLDALTNLAQLKCTEFDPVMSFVRVQVPLVKSKRGGGVRVKRLLMFDEGVKSSDPNVLYGQEYNYTTTFNGHIISSGVASNEPGIGRRENPLVNPIPKDEQSKFSAILFGRDMYSQEGPLGESLLPGPSVGYSAVTISSIHRGKTSTGTEVHEYYTYRDAPMVAKRTAIQQKSPTQWGLSAGGGGVSVSYSRKDPYMAQGYSFISYSLSGQPKRTSKYAAGLSGSPIAEEIYEYFKPGDQIKRIGEGLQIETVPFEDMGKESEMLSEIRQVEDISTGGNIGIDLSVGVLLPYPLLIPPIPIIIPTGIEAGFFVNEQIIRTHVTTKVINYPAVLKKSINIADGVTHTTEYTVFDKFTGSPVTVKTTDDFGGTYLSEDFKAAWKYDNMQGKFQNENLIIKASGTDLTMSYSTSGGKEYIVFGGNNGCGALANFTRGDLLKVIPASSVALYHVHEIDFLYNRLHILPSQMKSSIPSSAVTEINILRSGYTNQLNTKMGNIMKFGISTSTSIAPIITTHAFVTELNNKLNLNATANGDCGTFTVSTGAPYEHIDISYFASEIPAGCVSDLTDAAVMGVNFHFTVTNSVLNLHITSFTIRCDDSSTQLIQCHLVIPPC